MRRLTITIFLLATLAGTRVLAQDALPEPTGQNRPSDPVPELVLPESMEEPEALACSDLSIDNLLSVLDRYQVKCPKIVLAQALLETGYFSSDLCMTAHNLFGLRHPSDGSYYTFNNWVESVIAYRDDVQYKYTGGDYYAFLSRIGYAEDPRYVAKVRKIADKL